MRITLSLLLVLSACFCHANIVVNGSFENPNLSGQGMQQSAVNGSLGDWNAATDVVEIGEASYYGQTAYDQLQVAELGGTFVNTVGPKAAIYQDIVTVPGQSYVFSFNFTRRPSDNPNSDGFVASWDYNGSNATSFSLSMQPFWENVTANVVASSAITRIRFTEIGYPNGPGNGSLLDDVSVTPVPEPCSILILGTIAATLARKKVSSR